MRKPIIPTQDISPEMPHSVLPRLREMSRAPIKTSGFVSVLQCDTFLTPDFPTLGQGFDAVVCPVVVWEKPRAFGLAKVLAAGDPEISQALDALAPQLPPERTQTTHLAPSRRKLIVVHTEVDARAGVPAVLGLYRRTFSAVKDSGAKNVLLPLMGIQAGGVRNTAQIALTAACIHAVAIGMETVIASNDHRSVQELCQMLAK